MSYRFKSETLVDTYKKFKGMDGEAIINNRVKAVLKSNVSEVTTDYSMMDIYSGNRAEINNKLTAYLNESFGDRYGIEVLDKECESDRNEANIKEHVILRCFLEGYGYDVSKCLFEKSLGNGFCDIWYKLGKSNEITIETKRGDHPITISDIRQVMSYAKNKNAEFAILSNGYEFLLLDFNIVPESYIEDEIIMSYVVFWFDIFKVKGSNVTLLQYFEYMSYENIVVSQLTKYFCDIAQYRV